MPCPVFEASFMFPGRGCDDGLPARCVLGRNDPAGNHSKSLVNVYIKTVMRMNEIACFFIQKLTFKRFPTILLNRDVKLVFFVLSCGGKMSMGRYG